MASRSMMASTCFDVAGPYEMFNWVNPAKGLETVIVSEAGSSVKTMNGVRFEVQASFAATPALDVLWVPGGDPKVLGEIMSDGDSSYLVYLRQVAAKAKWVCSVCEGALLLARAGLLDGHKATTPLGICELPLKLPRNRGLHRP
ncbi:MAG: DJ-1/PfpI family protein [Bryobacteraceae bacterium]